MDVQTWFAQRFNKPPQVLVRAPGRVNLLGEHVDYNDGIVMPAAIDREMRFAASPLSEPMVTLCAIDLGEVVSFSIGDVAKKIDVDGKPLPTWALYPAGVAWVLTNAGKVVCGVQVAFTSNIPMGSGLSSSAALEVGFAELWQALGGWRETALRTAILSQKAENQYVGVACGLMDQFASACGVAGHALLFDIRSLEWQPLPLPAGTVIVIADSGVRRNLGDSGYNDRRAACEEAVVLLQKYKPEMIALRDISAPEFAAYAELLPPTVRKRAEHVVKEIARVQSMVSALEREDKQAMRALMFAGHASLRDLYEVSVPEIDTLVDIARTLPGCLGARLTGGGFGGCSVNLVEVEHAEAYIQGLQEEYARRTARQAQVYLCQASAGAEVIA